MTVNSRRFSNFGLATWNDLDRYEFVSRTVASVFPTLNTGW